jgi:hypothetical protein
MLNAIPIALKIFAARTTFIGACHAPKRERRDAVRTTLEAKIIYRMLTLAAITDMRAISAAFSAVNSQFA